MRDKFIMGDLITVIIPVYNAEKYIDDCVKSIVEQDYKELQIILIDDGSKDNSGSRLDCWSKKDSRIEVIHKKNEGVSAARNLGMKLAKGKWVCFVDADDCLDYAYLSDLIKSTKEDLSLEIIVSDFSFIYEKGVNTRFKSSYAEASMYGKLSIKECYQECANLKLWTGTVCGKLFLRTAINNIMFEPQAFSEDTCFMWELLSKERNVYVTKKKGYYYRINANSVTQDISRVYEKRVCQLRLLNQIREVCNMRNIETCTIEWNILWDWLCLYVGDINTQNAIKTIWNLASGKYCGKEEYKDIMLIVYQNVDTYSHEWIKSCLFIHEVKRLGRRLYKI